MKLYSDLEKEYLGRYFKYYRKINKVPIKEIYIGCSSGHDKYYGLEKGVLKSCNVYSDLLSNYQLTYNPNPRALEKTDLLLDSFYSACEEYNREQIIQLIHQTRKEIEGFKNSIFYDEINESLKMMYKFYIEEKYVSLEEAYKMIEISRIFRNRFGACLLEICASSNWYYLYNYDISEKLYKQLGRRNDLMSQFWLAEEYQVRMNLFKTEEVLQKIKKEYQKKLNYNRETETLLNLFFLHREVNKEQAETDLIELIQLLKRYKVKDKIMGKANHSIGMYYYRNQKYEEAIPYFRESYKIQKRMSSLFFMYVCQNKLEKDIEIYENVDKNDPIYPYVKYFELKQAGEDSMILEKYIMNDVMDLLKKEKGEEPMWTIFDYELSQIVKRNRSYKIYEKYHKMMRKITKA